MVSAGEAVRKPHVPLGVLGRVAERKWRGGVWR